MRKVKTDLHNHLGKNGKNPGFDETIDLVHSRLGEGGIFGICNDGYVDFRYEEFVNQSGGKYERVKLDEDGRVIWVREKDIHIVGVEEVESKQGHFIVAGMPQNKKIQINAKTMTLEDALKKANDFNGIKIVVHPMGRDGLGKYLDKNFRLFAEFDGWEVYNASAELSVPGILPRKANEKSAEYYFSDLCAGFVEMGVCAFTDGHSVGVIGKSYTKVPRPMNISSEIFIEGLRNGIRENQDFDNLYFDSAKWDCLKHVYHMVNHMAFGTGA